MIHKNKDSVKSLSFLYQYTHLSTLTVTYTDIAARQVQDFSYRRIYVDMDGNFTSTFQIVLSLIFLRSLLWCHKLRQWLWV